MADLIWHPEAISELDEICDYIAEDSPTAAAAFARRVVAAVEHLTLFPRSARIVPEREDDTIREVLVGDYRIIYRIVAGGVQIVTVHHGARLLGEIREAEGQ